MTCEKARAGRWVESAWRGDPAGGLRAERIEREK